MKYSKDFIKELVYVNNFCEFSQSFGDYDFEEKTPKFKDLRKKKRQSTHHNHGIDLKKGGDTGGCVGIGDKLSKILSDNEENRVPMQIE